jgi:hypothetical protein
MPLVVQSQVSISIQLSVSAIYEYNTPKFGDAKGSAASREEPILLL